MDGVATRIQTCRALIGAQRGSPESQAAFGQAVGKLLGAKPISAGTVSRWESGEFEPTLDTLIVIAKLAAVDPGWLAFGPISEAPSPTETVSRRVGSAVSSVLGRAFAKAQRRNLALESLQEAVAEFEQRGKADNKSAGGSGAKKPRPR